MISTEAAAKDYNNKELDNKVAEGLDFIIHHLKEPVWPRTISNKTTEGRQVLAYDREEAFAIFSQANFLDCRINAYPNYTGFKDLNRQAPDFIFIDLDQSTFKTQRAHRLALSITLNNIKEKLNGVIPTVLRSGNGFHVYQPMEAFPLEREQVFSAFQQPSKSFLRFAEKYLSNNKADFAHSSTVSFNNYMVRIPGSYNSKCVQKNNNVADISSEVKITQRWDGHRPKIKLLLGSFLAYLVDQKFKEIEHQQKQQFSKYRYDNSNNSDTIIHWIEPLLQTPLCDHRKYCIWRILAPYLMNVRRLSYEECFMIMKNWLDKCNQVERLNFNAKAKIKEGLYGAQKKSHFPIRIGKLKEENKELYGIVAGRL
jgi:hypothetical protein